MSLAGDLRGQPGVALDCREVIEPVHVAGDGVEAQKVVREARELSGLEVGRGRLELGLGEGARAPGFPQELAGGAVGLGIGDVKDAPVEGAALHLGDVAPHERRVGLVPAELDQELRRDPCARLDGRAAEQGAAYGEAKQEQ